MAANRTRYVPHRRGMRQLMQSSEMARMLRAAAENGKSAAEAIAPRDTGTYADSFGTDTRIVGDRQTAVLYNTVKYATVLEVKHRVLGRAVDSIRP